MLPHLFAHPLILFQGLLAGFLLGILFHKAKLSQFNVIVGQFLLKDFTVLKFLMTAIIVGSIGVHFFKFLDLPVLFDLSPDSAIAVVIGGVMFGVGMVVLGYCPGTCVVAAGQGSKDAWWGILGMLSGAFFYAEIYTFMKRNVLKRALITQVKLQDIFGVSPWVIILVLVAIALVLFKFVLSGTATYANKANKNNKQPVQSETK